MFASAWSVEHVEKGRRLAAQGEPESMERIILDGRAISQISDTEGGAVSLAFTLVLVWVHQMSREPETGPRSYQ